MPSPSLRALVAGLIDYAGLFPPASRSMHASVERYERYRESPEAWMLGRFVVPAARLDELAAEAAPLVAADATPRRLSALIGDDAAADAARIRAFNVAHAARFVVDVAEVRAATAERIEGVTRELGALVAYVELPHDADPATLLDAVQLSGARAKIRTGGVTRDVFPTAEQIARFLVRCAERAVPFKATAGLHHPLRGEHRLTYEPDAPSATMFGFLNVFVAGAMATVGAGEVDLVAVLEERQHSAFEFLADGLRWRSHSVTLEQLASARASFAVAFGSCSFREPVHDLQELGLL